jgi:hypothetical protein
MENQGKAAPSVLLSRIEEALAVHDRFESITDFSAIQDGDLFRVYMTVNTNEGPVDIEGEIA